MKNMNIWKIRLFVSLTQPSVLWLEVVNVLAMSYASQFLELLVSCKGELACNINGMKYTYNRDTGTVWFLWELWYNTND